jgi:hypothetical protein
MTIGAKDPVVPPTPPGGGPITWGAKDPGAPPGGAPITIGANDPVAPPGAMGVPPIATGAMGVPPIATGGAVAEAAICTLGASTSLGSRDGCGAVGGA